MAHNMRTICRNLEYLLNRALKSKTIFIIVFLALRSFKLDFFHRKSRIKKPKTKKENQKNCKPKNRKTRKTKQRKKYQKSGKQNETQKHSCVFSLFWEALMCFFFLSGSTNCAFLFSGSTIVYCSFWKHNCASYASIGWASYGSTILVFPFREIKLCFLWKHRLCFTLFEKHSFHVVLLVEKYRFSEKKNRQNLGKTKKKPTPAL